MKKQMTMEESAWQDIHERIAAINAQRQLANYNEALRLMGYVAALAANKIAEEQR